MSETKLKQIKTYLTWSLSAFVVGFIIFSIIACLEEIAPLFIIHSMIGGYYLAGITSGVVLFLRFITNNPIQFKVVCGVLFLLTFVISAVFGLITWVPYTCYTIYSLKSYDNGILWFGRLCLWHVKFTFIALCLGIWFWLMPMGTDIIPALINQHKYYTIAKDFIKEKYGENVKVKYPFDELNMSNIGCYMFYFDLQGEECCFVYEINSYDDKPAYYGDTGQSKELRRTVNEALNEIYGTRISLEDIDHEIVTAGWNDSNLYYADWEFVDIPYYSEDGVENAVLIKKYTGDNLEEFPIQISLYYDVGIQIFEEEDLQKLYYDVADTLKEYDIDCNEVHLYCERIGHRWFKIYHINETSEGLEIVKEDEEKF